MSSAPPEVQWLKLDVLELPPLIIASYDSNCRPNLQEIPPEILDIDGVRVWSIFLDQLRLVCKSSWL